MKILPPYRVAGTTPFLTASLSCHSLIVSRCFATSERGRADSFNLSKENLLRVSRSCGLK